MPDGRELILENCAVATSGDNYRFVEYQGKRFSHIIDPRTGYGVTHERTVTVIAELGCIADGWASAISILTEEEIAQLKDRGTLDNLDIIIN